MKYVYTHGNKFWYQRIVPKKLVKRIGLKSIKVSLNTNKLQLAVQRSKIQALEHTKMFLELKKRNNSSVIKFIKNKKINIKNYEMKFLHDYEDFVSNYVFSKKKTHIIKKIQNNNKKITAESFFFKNQYYKPLLSEYYKSFFLHEYNFKPNELFIFKESVDLLISYCGDRPLDEYNENHVNFFLNSLNDSQKQKKIVFNLSKIFGFAIKNKNIRNSNIFKIRFNNFKIKSNTNVILSSSELTKLNQYCYNNDMPETFILGIMLNTGCSFEEAFGLDNNDIYIDNFQSFVSIRSNSYRKISNINKIRTIPLIGISRHSSKKMLKAIASNTEINRKDSHRLKYKVNKIFKNISNNKPLISIKNTLISRLINLKCPEEVILEIIGKSRRHSLYNGDVSLDIKRIWLEQLESN